ncbi:MAG: ABC transporter permease [Clostridia bacterium]|nr:ABC transporter permease [Clostridia bacterium]
MREFLTVLGYTFRENARKKIFIISNIIILILVAVVMNIPAAIKYFENNDKGSADGKAQKEVVFVVDSKGVYKEDISKLGQVFTGYDFKSESADKLGNLKEKVKNGEGKGLVVIDEKGGVPYFDYWVKQYGSGLAPDELSRALKGIFTAKTLKAANVSDNVAAAVMSDVSYKVEELGKGMMKSYMAAMIVIVLLFFAVYFYGYGVSMSVASEKTSRVMELLITSTKPSKIVLGKSVAMGLLGLCQLASVVGIAALFYNLTFPKDFVMAGQKIDFSSLTPFAILMVIVYFILGYSLYAMMNAVAGATVSKAEDVNSAIMPISMITMVAFYLSYGSVAFPDGGVSTAASIIPFSAPFSMPSRIIMTEVPVWQIAASLGATAITTVLMAWISIRLYSSAVLHYGKRLKVGDLVKMSRQ